MNILVLIPRRRRIEVAFFGEDDRAPLLEWHRSVLPPEPEALADALGAIRADCTVFHSGPPDLVVIRSAYGGAAFTGTTRVDEEMLRRFAALAPEAPMHVPPAHLLARASLQAFGGAVVVLAFETAFFVDLPPRERRYGIADSRVRRFGYHGLYHQAAAAEREELAAKGPTRTLSLCLEPQPEMAAIIGHRPVMVTGGATPLEGLPGETTCGELDPTIVLTMARSLRWGPEQINDALTRHSGLRGLLAQSARPATLGDVLSKKGTDTYFGTPQIGVCPFFTDGGPMPRAAEGTPAAARNILAYRVLLAAGAGVAAMGGLDRIVLTGRYAPQGLGLAQWLAQRLRPAQADCRASMPDLPSAGASARQPAVVLCRTSLPRILADQGATAAYAELDSSPSPAPCPLP